MHLSPLSILLCASPFSFSLNFIIHSTVKIVTFRYEIFSSTSLSQFQIFAGLEYIVVMWVGGKLSNGRKDLEEGWWVLFLLPLFEGY